MDIIDAHSHLWLTQDVVVDGCHNYPLGRGRSMFFGEERQMLPPFMVDGTNTAEVFLANMDYARVGAKYTYNSMKDSWEGIPDPDVVIEAVGSVPTYQMAVDKVAFTGRIVCIGYAKSDVELNTGLFVKKELDIMGSRNANPSDFEAVIRYLSKGDAPVESFISDIIVPEETQATLEKWNAAPGKVYRILAKFE